MLIILNNLFLNTYAKAGKSQKNKKKNRKTENL